MNIYKLFITICLVAVSSSIYCMKKQSALHDAAYYGDLFALRTILISDQTPDDKYDDNCGQTALGLLVDSQNAKGQTALMLAAAAGHVNIVDALVHTYNASITIIDSKEQTALHYVAQKGKGRRKDRRRIATLLLKKGASVHARSLLGFTPLHNAIKSNQINIAQVLLQHNADLEIEDITGSTPLDYARAKQMVALFGKSYKKGTYYQSTLARKKIADDLVESPTLGRLKMARKKIKTLEKK